jgi:hypothetical protein
LSFVQPHPLEQFGRILCVADPVEETRQLLAFDQARGPDPDRRHEVEEFLGGAGLKLVEPFQVATVVVRADGVRHRAGDLVQPGEPGDRARHWRNLPKTLLTPV